MWEWDKVRLQGQGTHKRNLEKKRKSFRGILLLYKTKCPQQSYYKNKWIYIWEKKKKKKKKDINDIKKKRCVLNSQLNLNL